MFIGLLLLAAMPPAGAGERVRVGIYENMPKVGKDEAGRPAGIFVDILEAVARKEGWTLEYVPGSWGEGLDRLAAGQIDLMPDVAQTPERDRHYDFHREAVISSWFQVYTRKGSGVRALPDLANKRLLVLERSVQKAAFERLAEGFDFQATLIDVPDYAGMFARLAAGEADAAITNRYYGLMHAERHGLEDTSIVFHPTKLFFAASKGSDDRRLAAIDRHLQAFKQDPSSVYYRALRRWIGDETRTAVPRWLTFTTLAIAALLLASVIWAVTLHRTTARLRASEARQRQLAEELVLARDAAEAADRVKSAFLATMSHELRTPLNAIIGFTGLVLQELPGPLNDEQKKQLGMVRDSSRHLLALINDVLDISKIEAGELKVAHEPFDLGATVGKVAGIVAPLAETKGLALRLEGLEHAGAMNGDARRVEQILMNLLSNAIKFTEAGSVTLSVRRINDYSQKEGAAPRAAVRLGVTDTGMGIRPEDMAQLFQPFRQIDSSLTRQHEGTGLGLAICRRLAALMGGRIEAESRLGEGSTFSLTLPLDGIGERP
jgi:signal transduction histidine kinase